MKKMQKYIAKNKTIFVGLEDSKKSWKICVRAEGQIIHETSMPAHYSNLKSYLQNNYPDCQITVLYEAGFRGFNLYDHLTDDGNHCIVTPPNKVTAEKDFRYKNDRTDCRRLAKNLEANDYKECFVPDPERRKDRQVSRTLVQVQKDITRTRNRIRKFLEFHGIDEHLKPGRWSEKDYNDLKTLQLEETLQFCFDILLQQLDRLKKTRRLLLHKLREIREKPRYVKTFTLFKSAPGIGWLTAIRLVLEWGEDLSRFDSDKQFGSFLGLVCSEYSTGDSVRYGHITRQSAYFIRAWLIQCAWVAINKDPILNHKYQRIMINSGNKKKAIVAVARKLAIRLRHCALTNEPYCVGVIQ